MTTRVSAASVLENARVVHDDRVQVQSLAFLDGVVAEVDGGSFRVDLRDHLILPGFINAHDHLQLNAIPPLVHTDSFPNSYAWIDAFETHLRSPAVVEARKVPDDVRHWHGALKNVLSGVTTVAHHDPWHPIFDDANFPVHVIRDQGWSHSLRLGETHDGRPLRYGTPVRESFAATSMEHPWIIHLAEGTDNVANAELARLDALGCLAANTVIVHGVGLTWADVDRVIDRRASVVWCPTSNLGMLGRTISAGSIRRLFDAGLLALGSDSRLTGAISMLEELRAATATSDLSPAELLHLMTKSASRVLRATDTGGLTPGQRADCVLIRDTTGPRDALAGLCRGEIRAVVRGGTPVIADPDFGEWFEESGVDVVPVQLDGRPKLLARDVMWMGALALEPGLELQ